MTSLRHFDYRHKIGQRFRSPYNSTRRLAWQDAEHSKQDRQDRTSFDNCAKYKGDAIRADTGYRPEFYDWSNQWRVQSRSICAPDISPHALRPSTSTSEVLLNFPDKRRTGLPPWVAGDPLSAYTEYLLSSVEVNVNCRNYRR